MKICIFQHGKISLPVIGYGGIQRITENICYKLVDSGHDITLVTIDDSTIQYEGLKVLKYSFEDLENIRYGRIPIDHFFDGDIFLSHTSGPHQSFNFGQSKCEWFAWCHGDLGEAVGAENQIFVSNNQAKLHIERNKANKHCKNIYVCNGGINVDNLNFSEGPHDKIVWFGRLCRDKGIHILSSVAERINQKIIVAGNITNENVSQVLNHNLINYYGEIKTDAEKCKLFSNAKCYIHTSTFNDPFPLTILEAQACGIPVITFANGSMKESCRFQSLVFSDYTKFVNGLKSHKFSEYEPLTISNWAKEKFSFTNVAKNLIQIFNKSNEHLYIK